MIYQSKQCLPYFSAVVKNVASPNIEIKKLVYIYLLHYAESEPDLALLSINTIQKSLSDQNAQVRAMALRVMSGIRVTVISQIVLLAIKKGCADLSPLVRKAAALAIPKCYSLDPGNLPQLLEYVSQLLGDKQYYVIGSAVTAFLEICPDRIDLIHKHYRALVRKLVDMDDWGQLATIRLMTYYARRCFPRRYSKIKDTPRTLDGEEKTVDEPSGQETLVLDTDLELLLKACRQLLTSRNVAVVVAIARVFKYVGTPEYLDLAIGPMVALLRSPRYMQQTILYDLVVLCIDRPGSFVPYVQHFLISASEPAEIWRLKLELLTLVFPHCDEPTKGLILNEFEHFSTSTDESLVRESVRAIGRCASDESASKRCLYLLLNQTSSEDGMLVGEALNVVRKLIQQDPGVHRGTIIRLAKHLDTMLNPEARANVIWLVGEFSGVGGPDNIAPDVLRILVQNFANESETAKQQIVLLAARVYLHHVSNTAKDAASRPTSNEVDLEESATAQADTDGREDPIAILWEHVLLLARYDTSYDLRDRARLFKALMANPNNTQLAKLLLLAPKPVPHTPSPSESRKHLLLGSATLVVGEDAGPAGLSGYEPLPDCVTAGQEPDQSLRDEPESGAGSVVGSRVTASQGPGSGQPETTAAKPSVFAGGNKDKSLDDWLAEEEKAEQEQSEGSTETESEEEETSESEEESEEESGEESPEDDARAGSSRRLLPS